MYRSRKVKTVNEILKELLREYGGKFKKRDLREFARLLSYIDRVLRKAWEIYRMGASVTVYFDNLSENYAIPETLREVVEVEIGKRDVGKPKIEWYRGLLDRVVIMNPFG